MRYGPSVVQYYRMPADERADFMVNPMCEAFPRIAACHYYRYGSGGRQEMLDAICILGLNMINDKVFPSLCDLFVDRNASWQGVFMHSAKFPPESTQKWQCMGNVFI